MKRVSFKERSDWKQKCEAVGFNFHSLDGVKYWNEEVGYEFSLEEIELIESATEELHKMCLDLVSDIIDKKDYSRYWFKDDPKIIELIENSWNKDDKSIYGRFDLGFSGNEIKMFEYNADTPTSLLEAAVVQCDWMKDNGLPDQFNSIHEKLINRFKEIKQNNFHFTTMQNAGVEDWVTIHYLMEVYMQSGFDHATSIDIEEIRYSEKSQRFYNAKNEEIKNCFKLYPWEWIMADEFGKNITCSNINFFEPPWKMLLSNKIILPLLWKKFPGHRLLLESYFENEMTQEILDSGVFVKKPLLSREGSDIQVIEFGIPIAKSQQTEKTYVDSGFIYQRYFDVSKIDGYCPVIGSWIVGDIACGMGIREDTGITGNNSLFTPHYFV